MKKHASCKMVLGLAALSLFFLVAGGAQGENPDLESRVEQLESSMKRFDTGLRKDTSTKTAPALSPFGGVPITFGALIDTYYAFDFKEPSSGMRAFTTQPAKHNAFDVNLAFVDVRVNQEAYRGRLALQFGTSVDINYAAEPSEISRHIQEAYVGYSPFRDLWIDAGVYFSHIGFESFISRDNWNYSRSLAAEFSPYYETGIRVSYQWTKEFSTQLHLLNGWQNIAETNSAKALGMQLAFQPNEHLAFTYNNFIGKEVGDKMRYYHDFIVKTSFRSIEAAFIYDIGIQQRDPNPGDSVWQAYTLLARYQIHPIVSVGARGERFIDKDQSIVATNTPNGYQTWGASANIDMQILKNVVWRNEYRHFWSGDQIYPNKTNGSKQDHFAVTAIALTF